MKTERLKFAHRIKSFIGRIFNSLFILLIFSSSMGLTHGFAKEISGYIRTLSGSGISDVTITFENIGSSTTNSSGYYSKGIPNSWSGTAAPSKDGYRFDPVSRIYNDVTLNQSNQNYTGTQNQQAPSISGYVRAASGSGISGVTITFDNGGGTDTTDSSGYYSREVAYGWSGTAVPSKDGYRFDPVSRIYNDVTSDQLNQDYNEHAQDRLLSITINIVGSGYVEIDPDKNFYAEGSFITLTATADSGWIFSEWNRGLQSSDNPENIAINSDMTITAVFTEDYDNDGVSDKEENAGPNNGDGNNDGIIDSIQSNVSFLVFGNATDYVAIETPPGTSIKNCKTEVDPPNNNYPSDIEFLYGFFSFAVEGIGIGGSTSVTFYFPSFVTFNTYSKYGPTPDDPFDHWYEFIFDDQTGAEINKNIITLHFVDGIRGDDDLTEDGNIIDLGGPGVRTTAGPEPDSRWDLGGEDSYGCFIGCLF